MRAILPHAVSGEAPQTEPDARRIKKTKISKEVSNMRENKSFALKVLSVALALALVIGGAGLAFNGSAASAEEKVVVTSPFTQAVKDVRDSVVGINNYQTVRYANYGSGFGGFGWDWDDFFGYGSGGNRNNGGRGQESTQEVKAGSGSGVVIAEGYVLTNHHVVDGASKLTVAVMQEGASEPVEYDATLVAQDENLDVAVVYCPSLKLQPVALGDSDTLQVGDWAICIGNPLGDTFYGTVTAGIVSALNRNISSTSYDKYGRRETVTNTMIQVDAAINSGNSGGGMFSVSGELMGIPTIKYTGSAFSGASIDGIGMCIPINAAKPLISDVLSGVIKTPEMPETDDTQRSAADSSLTGKPRLGITVNTLNPSASAIASGRLPNGVYVREVEANSPADEAGMKAGDIIVEMEEAVVTSVSQLTGIVGEHGEGDTLQVKVFRAEGLKEAVENGGEVPEDGEYIDLFVTLRVVDDVKQ